jgi:hypothetical protein
VKKHLLTSESNNLDDWISKAERIYAKRTSIGENHKGFKYGAEMNAAANTLVLCNDM